MSNLHQCPGCGLTLNPVVMDLESHRCRPPAVETPMGPPQPRGPLPSCAVVIPCHNYGRFLAECLDSVLSQTVPPHEVLVVLDDCSDNSAEVAARYRSRGVQTLTVRCCDPFLSRRAGFKAVSSDVVCLLDADDCLSPDYLEQGLPLFADPKVGIVTPHCELFGAVSRTYVTNLAVDIEQENTVTSAALVRSAAVDRSDVMERLDLVAEQYEDWYFWRYLCRNGWTIAQSTGRHLHRRHDHNRSLAFEVPWAVGLRSESGYEPPRKTRLLMLTPSLAAGGVSVNTLQKLQDRRDVEWVGIILTDGAASDPAIVSQIAQVVPVYGGAPHAVQNAPQVDRSQTFLQRLRTFRGAVDAIYTWGHGPEELPQILQDEFPTTAVIVGLHGEGPWTRTVVETFAEQATTLYCVSRSVLKCVPEANLSRCTVIPNGVDLRNLVPHLGRETTRERWGVEPHEIAVGFVGRISPEKNPTVIAGAVARLGAGYRAVYISPQAHGPRIWGVKERDDIERTRTSAPIVWAEGIIAGTPADHQTLMADAYQALDVLVMPSHEEGGPLVVLEAFVAGCPVVASPVGLLPGLIKRFGELAVLTPAHPTAQDVATAIPRAIHPARVPLTRQARELAIYELNSRRMVRDFERMVVAAAAQPRATNSPTAEAPCSDSARLANSRSTNGRSSGSTKARRPAKS